MTETMQFGAQQTEALLKFTEWFDAGCPGQVFKLFGYAGTGKTTIAKRIADQSPSALFGAYTGKAASVLRSKGCPAETLHKLAYLPVDKCRARLEDLEGLLADAREAKDQEAIETLTEKIEAERDNLRRPKFQLKLESEIGQVSLLVVDEVSMVDERMGRDLLSFETPILVLGDPAQLPPGGNSGFFIKGDPHAMLTEIHRQAGGSPVIELATAIREGRRVGAFDKEGTRVVKKGALKIDNVVGFDQILVGKNATRQALNRRVREHLGFQAVSPYPQTGDKVISLRNNTDVGILNGEIWRVLTCDPPADGRDKFNMRVGRVENEADQRDVVAFAHYFEGRENQIAPWEMREAEHFDYGYAITCHKAQGSEWPRVLVIDESATFRADRRKWLYTAVTRASESVTIVVK